MQDKKLYELIGSKIKLPANNVSPKKHRHRNMVSRLALIGVGGFTSSSAFAYDFYDLMLYANFFKFPMNHMAAKVVNESLETSDVAEEDSEITQDTTESYPNDEPSNNANQNVVSNQQVSAAGVLYSKISSLDDYSLTKKVKDNAMPINNDQLSTTNLLNNDDEAIENPSKEELLRRFEDLQILIQLPDNPSLSLDEDLSIFSADSFRKTIMKEMIKDQLVFNELAPIVLQELTALPADKIKVILRNQYIKTLFQYLETLPFHHEISNFNYRLVAFKTMMMLSATDKLIPQAIPLFPRVLIAKFFVDIWYNYGASKGSLWQSISNSFYKTLIIKGITGLMGNGMFDAYPWTITLLCATLEEMWKKSEHQVRKTSHQHKPVKALDEHGGMSHTHEKNNDSLLKNLVSYYHEHEIIGDNWYSRITKAAICFNLADKILPTTMGLFDKTLLVKVIVDKSLELLQNVIPDYIDDVHHHQYNPPKSIFMQAIDIAMQLVISKQLNALYGGSGWQTNFPVMMMLFYAGDFMLEHEEFLRAQYNKFFPVKHDHHHTSQHPKDVSFQTISDEMLKFATKVFVMTKEKVSYFFSFANARPHHEDNTLSYYFNKLISVEYAREIAKSFVLVRITKDLKTIKYFESIKLLPLMLSVKFVNDIVNDLVTFRHSEPIEKYLLHSVVSFAVPKALSAVFGKALWQENAFVMGGLFSVNNFILQLSYDGFSMLQEQFNNFFGLEEEHTELLGALDSQAHSE